MKVAIMASFLVGEWFAAVCVYDISLNISRFDGGDSRSLSIIFSHVCRFGKGDVSASLAEVKTRHVGLNICELTLLKNMQGGCFVL